MSAFLCFVLAAAPVDAGAPAPKKLTLPTPMATMKSGHAQDTKCAACHGTSGWTDVRFNHDRTGFPLTGQHHKAPCKSCHVVDFKVPVPRGCAGCHRDVHAGDLGARCEGCHDTTDWRSRFDADAHRRTNFPLFGAHAAIPCVECHAEIRERRFTRATVECAACHQADTAPLVGTAVDHTALGFEQRPCKECHGPLRFSPAQFPDHDRCFPISAGDHAGIGCQVCHTTLRASAVSGSCATSTAACTSCHEHACTPGVRATKTDQLHEKVDGYRCGDRFCYDCHKPVGAGR